jgi:2-polyprenyl-3-methyl-5-hydroxy-6-metoxy-1,4-benzoquinol methylase
MNDFLPCRICGSLNQFVLYTGDIRAGTIGRFESGYRVIKCANCDTGYLSPSVNLNYESEEYRELYNSTALVDDYFKLHDQKQLRFTASIRENLRGKVLADFGCGGGALLDFVKGVASHTVAVEPFIGYHSSLKSRGHLVYQYTEQYVFDSTAPRCDVGISSHVIEHVVDPVAYLKEISSSMQPGGVLYVATPNANDLLLELRPKEFASFFYRTAHAWYFSKKSLEWVARAAGFRECEVGHWQNYGLSNAFIWSREGTPSGEQSLPLFDRRIDDAWRSFLEETGRSDEIYMRLVK